MKKLFISQPMRDKFESYFPDYNPSNGCVPIKYLSKAIEMLADAAYFCKG